MMESPQIIQFEQHGNPTEGYICVAHFKDFIPFEVKRLYWTFHTPENITRGRHAHKESYQVLIAVSGTIHLELKDVKGSITSFKLNKPSEGILIPPNYWHTMKYSKDAVQLILASTDYEKTDYIRDYDAFLEYWSEK